MDRCFRGHMQPDPALPPELTEADTRALRMLARCHSGLAAMSVAGLCCLAGHWSFASWVFSRFAEVDGPGGAPLAIVEVGSKAQAVYVLFLLPLLATSIGNLLAAHWIGLRSGRNLILAVSALNALNMPFGTGLAIVTLTLLSRPNIRAVFAFSSGRG